MLERLRYVTQRRNRKGKLRWYWQRRGHLLTRLPDNLIDRVAMVERLNAKADGILTLERGSLGWVIQQYRESAEYRGRSPGTGAYYKRYLRDIEALGPTLPFASFTRRAVVDFIESYERPHQRRQA